MLVLCCLFILKWFPLMTLSVTLRIVPHIGCRIDRADAVRQQVVGTLVPKVMFIGRGPSMFYIADALVNITIYRMIPG